MSGDQFMQYLVSGLTQGSIYALVALGFTIIYAVTRIINFAQGEFVMIGGMLSFTLAVSYGIPLVPSLLLSVLGAAVIGILLYLLAIRTARRASVVSLIIITIGSAIFIRGIAGEVWGVDHVRPPFFTGYESISFAGAYIHPQALWIMGTTITVTVLLHLFLTYTMVGKALKACAINPGAAGLVGINARTMGLIAFGLATALGGIGGVVMAPLTLTAYNIGVLTGLKGFVAASIGGFKSPIAAVIGGFTLGIVEALAVAVNWGPFTSAYKDAIAIIVLMLVLLIRSGTLAAEERT
ncbi:MAG: branched-chain amino acid ABC transporter permease [Dehalococcoidia bacterium]|nr:branched-chain amino acid ABC transporter permease [Dehalococcoidia bacterium]